MFQTVKRRINTRGCWGSNCLEITAVVFWQTASSSWRLHAHVQIKKKDQNYKSELHLQVFHNMYSTQHASLYHRTHIYLSVLFFSFFFLLIQIMDLLQSPCSEVFTVTFEWVDSLAWCEQNVSVSLVYFSIDVPQQLCVSMNTILKLNSTDSEIWRACRWPFN